MVFERDNKKEYEIYSTGGSTYGMITSVDIYDNLMVVGYEQG